MHVAMFLVGNKMVMNAWIIMHGYVSCGNKMESAWILHNCILVNNKINDIFLIIFLWATRWLILHGKYLLVLLLVLDTW